MSYKQHYSRALRALGGKLHFRAHSHHPWPDASRPAHILAWDDAAYLTDSKWEKVFAEVLPAAQKHAADVLGKLNPSLIAFAPNTHEFILRLLSCLPQGRPPRVLTTDSEFHSFARQAARLEEEGCQVDRVPVEPIADFKDRFAAHAKSRKHDFVFLSQVFYNSGLRLSEAELVEIAAAAAPEAIVVVDGYHAFMAVPVDLSKLASRVFFLAGGYKYAQAGEGACLLAVPPGLKHRPGNTGWFSDFAGLEKGIQAPIGYGAGAMRFMGSTFDPTGLYRFNAVMDWRASVGLTVARSDAHVRALQARFLDKLAAKPKGNLRPENVISSDPARTGHFLTFRVPDAASLTRQLEAHGVLVDSRADRLRFGFGLYQDDADVDEAVERLQKLV